MGTLTLTPTLVGGLLRFVLSWPGAPNDLDIHSFFAVSQTQKCEVYFSKRSCVGVSLDVDNLSGGSKGVETITVNTLGNYIYTIAVNKYVDLTGGVVAGENNFNVNTTATVSLPNIPLVQAYAKISVYAPGFTDPILTLTAPSFIDITTVYKADVDTNLDIFDWWLALCFDGSIGVNSVTAINKYMNTKPKFTDCVNLMNNNNNYQGSTSAISSTISFGR